MIHFALRCANGHNFESWFRSSKDFDFRQNAGQLNCPHCGGSEIDKQLMAPAIASETAAGHGEKPAPAAVDTQNQDITTPPKADLTTQLRRFRNALTKDAKNVGSEFAEQARKMHYGEESRQAIYGVATRSEIHGLVGEGVSFLPLPQLPEDHNLVIVQEKLLSPIKSLNKTKI